MKVGEFFTTERIVTGGTGYRYALVRLVGEVALLGSETVMLEPGKAGGPELQRFTFQFLRPGQAEIQFARFRSFDLSDALYEEVMPFHVEQGNNDNLVKPGGWSQFENLTDKESHIFEKAMKELVGANYTPKKVSKQVVNGMNYRFFCYGTLATLGAETFPAIVKIHVASGNDQPQVMDIQRVLL